MITLLKLSPYTGDVVAPSPNHDARRAPAIEGIVLHATADQGEEANSLTWLRSPQSRVSSHLFVNRVGLVTRLVGDRERAWHAGHSTWRGTSDVNSITLGIEIANRNDGEPYTDAQYRRVSAIVAHYCRQGLSLDDVVSHGEIAESRRTDPHGWRWDRFRTMVQDQLPPAEVSGPYAWLAAPAPERVADSSASSSTSRGVPLPKSIGVTATPKPILRSRTLWLNVLTVLAAAGLLVNETLDLAGRVGIHLPANAIKWALLGVGIVNIILRLRTTRPLGGSQGADLMVPAALVAQSKEERRRRPRGIASAVK